MDIGAVKKSKNIYESNFIDSEALDDIEALEELAYRQQ